MITTVLCTNARGDAAAGPRDQSQELGVAIMRWGLKHPPRQATCAQVATISLMTLPDATLRFLRASSDVEFAVEPREFPEGTKTARDAAHAIGCEIAQIVKSLVFMADGTPVLAFAPGDLRLDPEKLAAAMGADSVRRASLDEVRTTTSYAAGGTPPFGHARTLPTYADLRLRRYHELWAAAGTPTTVFSVTLDDLDRAAEPAWVDLAVSEQPR